MSSAFVKEADGNDVVENLPERPVSANPNFVTAEGLATIEAELERVHREHAQAQAANDRATLARTARDLRYWTSRRTTAQVIAPPIAGGDVQFGSTVTIERDDGRRQTFRIVGEDEADPRAARSRTPRRWRVRCSANRSATWCRPDSRRRRSSRSRDARRRRHDLVTDSACK